MPTLRQLLERGIAIHYAGSSGGRVLSGEWRPAAKDLLHADHPTMTFRGSGSFKDPYTVPASQLSPCYELLLMWLRYCQRSEVGVWMVVGAFVFIGNKNGVIAVEDGTMTRLPG